MRSLTLNRRLVFELATVRFLRQHEDGLFRLFRPAPGRVISRRPSRPSRRLSRSARARRRLTDSQLADTHKAVLAHLTTVPLCCSVAVPDRGAHVFRATSMAAPGEIVAPRTKAWRHAPEAACSLLDGAVRGDQLLVIDQRIHHRLTRAASRWEQRAGRRAAEKLRAKWTVPVRCVRTAGPVRGGRVAATEVFG